MVSLAGESDIPGMRCVANGDSPLVDELATTFASRGDIDSLRACQRGPSLTRRFFAENAASRPACRTSEPKRVLLPRLDSVSDTIRKPEASSIRPGPESNQPDEGREMHLGSLDRTLRLLQSPLILIPENNFESWIGGTSRENRPRMIGAALAGAPVADLTFQHRARER